MKVFNEEVYNKKKQFVMRCIKYQCKQCPMWNGKGCTDPEHPKGSLLMEKPEKNLETKKE